MNTRETVYAAPIGSILAISGTSVLCEKRGVSRWYRAGPTARYVSEEHVNGMVTYAEMRKIAWWIL